EAEAILRARKIDRRLTVRVTVADEAPHQIVQWDTMPAIRAYIDQLLRDPKEDERGRLVQIRRAVEQAAKEHQFSGAVLIARGDKTLLEMATGSARLQPPTPNSTETKFHLGSMPKMFTATAALQLVQQGKIHLDAPISNYLADYPNQDHAKRITMHHLLTHTSGLGDYFGEMFDRQKHGIQRLEDYYPFFSDEPLQFEPGTDWSYSNAGMLLAGLIVERVSGMSYDDYLKQHVFARAGMMQTGNSRVTEQVDGLAQGYTRFNGADIFNTRPATQPNTHTLPPRGGPAGGGYSTLGDLRRFANALLGNHLLDAKHTGILTEGKVNLPFEAQAKYAYGFQEMSVAGTRVIGHSGGAPGMNAVMRIVPDRKLVVIVLSNYDPPFAQSLGRSVLQLLLQP
ncbi:MAG: beta-lactamase family protein, partial [Bryobacterales bacterium]|nr:beta-lactamase family protein [Bryobacterales bacterium]